MGFSRFTRTSLTRGNASSPCGAARACTRGSHPNSLQGGQRRTKAQRAAIVGAYEAGETIRQIADRLGFHRDTVSAALERESVARRYHQRVDVDLVSAAELERQGLTLTEIATALGVGPTTLIKARHLE